MLNVWGIEDDSVWGYHNEDVGVCNIENVNMLGVDTLQNMYNLYREEMYGCKCKVKNQAKS